MDKSLLIKTLIIFFIITIMTNYFLHLNTINTDKKIKNQCNEILKYTYQQCTPNLAEKAPLINQTMNLTQWKPR